MGSIIFDNNIDVYPLQSNTAMFVILNAVKDLAESPA